MIEPVNGAAPVVTVVAATCNRRDLVIRLLDALAAQDFPDPFEVVIVDDASSDGTPQVLEEWARTAPFPMTVMVNERNSGPAVARNRGWRAARAPLVCFTDDDCRPQPQWLATLVGVLASGEVDVVQGSTIPDPSQRDRLAPFSRTMQIVVDENPFFETCNIGYRRDLLEKLGGLDESFPYPYGEDCDLGWRAKKAGARTTFTGDALVHHEVHPSDFVAFRRSLRRSEGLVQMISKHPEIREAAGVGLFWRPIHKWALWLFAALGVVAIRPRSRLAWTFLGFMGARYQHICKMARPMPRSKTEWLIVLPQSLVVDLYETGVLAMSSVKYRTPLL
jgi:GT2 family glycosyltransferase